MSTELLASEDFIMTTILSQIHVCRESHPLCICRYTQGRQPAKSVKISKISKSPKPECAKWRPDIVNISNIGNWHWIFTLWTLTFWTFDIYTVNILTLGKISFQLPPPGSSKIGISFQLLPPDSSTTSAKPPARHLANQLLTLLPCHTHIMAARSVVV